VVEALTLQAGEMEINKETDSAADITRITGSKAKAPCWGFTFAGVNAGASTEKRESIS
jgi:hypothetical protein